MSRRSRFLRLRGRVGQVTGEDPQQLACVGFDLCPIALPFHHAQFCSRFESGDLAEFRARTGAGIQGDVGFDIGSALRLLMGGVFVLRETGHRAETSKPLRAAAKRDFGMIFIMCPSCSDRLDLLVFRR